MKKQIEEFNKLASQHKNLASYIIGGILALTVAFGLGRITAPIDRKAICQKYTDDILELEEQLKACRRSKVVDCDERIQQCHKEESAACDAKLEAFRRNCETLACQE